jgi:aspartyl protease family protein
MRSVITFAAAALVAGMIIPHYAEQMRSQSEQPAPKALTAARATAQPRSASYSDSVEVPRDAMGHFNVDGRVNGRSLQFVIDTGASLIALTADNAAQLGIHPAESEYTVTLRTANGTVRAAPTMLDMVEVGDISVQNVRAVVLPEGALSENLLGMSFLSRLRHFDYSDGKMVLEQ